MTSQAPPALRNDFATAGLLVFSLLGFADSLFNYFWTGNGIHGTEGALLVIVSTLLMSIAAGLIAARRVHGWVANLFEVLIFLDFLGTALAAYLLDAWLLLAFVVLAFVAWVAHVLRPFSRASNFG